MRMRGSPFYGNWGFPMLELGDLLHRGAKRFSLCADLGPLNGPGEAFLYMGMGLLLYGK